MSWEPCSIDHSMKDSLEDYSDLSSPRWDVTYGMSSQSIDLVYEFLKTINHELPGQTKTFEDIVTSFLNDLQMCKNDIQRLEAAYIQEKQNNEQTVKQMIDEAEQQLAQVGEKIKHQQRQEDLKAQERMKVEYESQIRVLRENLAKMQDYEKKFHETKHNGDFIVDDLRATLENLKCENSQLNKSLREAKTEISVLRGEVAELKSSEGENYNQLILNDVAAEVKQLKNEIETLQNANKKLDDANDLLRSELEFYKLKPNKDELALTPAHSSRSVSGSMGRKSIHSGSNINDFSIDDDVESGFVPSSSNVTELSDFQFETDNSLFFPQNFTDQAFRNEANTAIVPKSTPITTRSERESPVHERVFKVVFSGDSAVGKTSFIMRYCKGTFYESLSSTLGIDFHTKNVNMDGKNMCIQLVDTCGQERFRSLSKSYFRRAEGAVLLYDCTCENSFSSVKEWINIINETTDKKIPIIIVANKIDLRDEARKMPDARVIEREEGAKLAADFDCLFVEASAKSGTNMEESLLELCRKMTSNEEPDEIVNNTEVIKLTPEDNPSTASSTTPAKKKGRCC